LFLAASHLGAYEKQQQGRSVFVLTENVILKADIFNFNGEMFSHGAQKKSSRLRFANYWF
jgi:hypothetical protein